MCTNIELDNELVTEALKFSNARNRRQLIHEALLAFISERGGMDLRKLKSSGGIATDYDFKAMRACKL